MGQKYSSNSASGYNTTPPADNGTVSEDNKGKWSTIKTKLADPVKDLVDTINTELVTHFDNGPVAYTDSQTIGTSHYGQTIQISGASKTLTFTDAATLGAGFNCEIVSVDATNTVTVARATASDMINETTANLSLLPLQQIKAVVNAAANGFLISVQGRHSKTYQSAEARTLSGIHTHTAQVRWAKGADVASANALTLLTDGNYFDITGTTAITSIGTLGVGTWIKLHFDDALTLTHHATDLILPSAANITTVAGDEAEFVEYATGDWRCTSYSRASGVPLAAPTAGQGSSLVLLQAQTASASATIDFTTNITSTYDEYELHLINVIPATDDSNLWLRVDSNGGASFETADYAWCVKGASTLGTDYDASSVGVQAQMRITSSEVGGGVANASTNGVCGVIKFFSPSSTALYKRFTWNTCYGNKEAGTNPQIFLSGGGAYIGATSAIDAIRFLFSTGNIASGSLILYGVKKT